MTVLAEYDEAWAAQYAVMAAELAAVFGDTVTEVEHIGSTAVPGLVAKPVIDIAARAISLEVASGKDSQLAELGRYSELKRRLAIEGLTGFDYTVAKTTLIQELTDDARRLRGLPSVPVWES